MSKLRIVKIGGEYDAASANGWHIVREIKPSDEIRSPAGAMLILDGPFPTKAQAEMRRKVMECQ
jgi:hypothetical protein